METAYSPSNWIDTALWIWFALTAVSVAYVAWDLFTRTPEMKVMKWGWILVTLYTGIVGVVVYWFSCREPAPARYGDLSMRAGKMANMPMENMKR